MLLGQIWLLALVFAQVGTGLQVKLDFSVYTCRSLAGEISKKIPVHV